MKLYRAEGVLDVDLIGKKKIIGVGLGSLGSMALDNLAYPWGSVVLADHDVLSIANVERHVLGIPSIDVNKAVGMKEYLVKQRGMDERTITSYAGNIQDILPKHTDANLVLINVDNRQAREDVNAWCIENDIPALYGGIYPRGTGGEVMVITKPREVCYICAEQVIGGNKYQGKIGNDYGVNPAALKNESGDPVAVPALRGIIGQVATSIASFTIEILSGNFVQPQIHVQASEMGEDLLIFSPGQVPSCITELIAQSSKLGIYPPFSLSRRSNGYALRLTRSGLSLIVPRWNRCPNHQNLNSSDF